MKLADMRCAVNREFLQANSGRSENIFLTIDLTPGEVTPTGVLPPNIALLLDSSGSMSEYNKMEVAKNAAVKFLESLENIDNLSVITFANSTHVIGKGSQSATFSGGGIGGFFRKVLKGGQLPIDVGYVADKKFICDQIRRIRPGGGTNLYGAIQTAFNQLKGKTLGGDQINKILLLSDGDPTVGNTDADSFANLARKIGTSSIPIIAGGIGGKLGGSYNEDILIAVAQNSGGNWANINSPEQIIELFEQEATRVRDTTFVRPKIKIHTSTGVEVGEIYKAKPESYKWENVEYMSQDPDIGGEDCIITAPDLVRGEEQTFVVKLQVPPKSNGEWRIAHIDLLGATGKDILITYTDDASLYGKENPSPRLLYFITTVRVKGREPTKIREEKEKMETLIRTEGKNITHIRDLQSLATETRETLIRLSEAKSKDERQEGKEGLTKVRKRR